MPRRALPLHAQLRVHGGARGNRDAVPGRVDARSGPAVPNHLRETDVAARFAGEIVVFPERVGIERFEVLIGPVQGTFVAALEVAFKIHEGELKLFGEILTIDGVGLRSR